MPKKRYSAEEIIHKLREADVLLAQAGRWPKSKHRCITDQTYCRWRKAHGRLKVDQAKRLKELETENARLKRAATVTNGCMPCCSQPVGKSVTAGCCASGDAKN